ncbi:hypothetical protein [Rhizobium sp. Root1204]|uniref:hypothetical protein n=1 Tax=Rhizobium sp. Root1204 TaxID=1736428 RepID=UPI0032979CEB
MNVRSWFSLSRMKCSSRWNWFAPLRDAEFDVLGPAGSVADAFDLIKTERPDAAVLDVRLGTERVPVAAELKTLGVPYVIASASHPSELASEPVLSDVANLGKPTDLDRLVRVMQAFCR